MQMHSRDRRKWFAANFGRSYFKSAPLINPSGLVALAVPCILLLVVVLLAAHPHFAAGAALLPIPATIDIQEQFDGLKKDLREYFVKAEEQQKSTGTITTELKTKIEALQKQADALDVKLAERHTAGTAPIETLRKTLEENEHLQYVMRTKNGNCVIELSPMQVKQIWERKTTITETAVGSASTGVMPIERIPGIVPEARQQLAIRDMLVARPTTQLLVDFVKVTTAPSAASPQTEESEKFQNKVLFTAYSEQIKTLATWIPASRQVLDDMSELMNYLMTMLPYYVDKAEEVQLLSGDNTGQNLHGLI